MDRNEQYAAAPQRFLPEGQTARLTYVEGQNIYALPHTNVINISAVQVLGYEGSEPITRGVGLQDTDVRCPGGPFNYLVRLWRPDPTNEPDTWHEEALIPNEHFTVSYVADIFNENTNRIERSFNITWQAPIYDGSEVPPPLEWEYPLGEPEAKINKEDLPVATPPVIPPDLPEEPGNLDPPRNPPVLEGNKYRIYTEGLVNATGAEITPSGAAIDLTNLNPKPRPGLIIVYYETGSGTLLDKS